MNGNDFIRIRGAQQHNLKGIDVDVPVQQLTVVTGPSGSGKSSLVFDTLYAEGQRRYVESLSAYARQFLERLQRPKVDEIVGIRPAVAIRQKNSSRNPRSTVGTVTEIYDYLRLLFARVGQIRCHECGRPVQADTVEGGVDTTLQRFTERQVYLTFPLIGSRFDPASQDTESRETLGQKLQKNGYRRLLKFESKKALSVIRLQDTVSFPENHLEQFHILVDRVRACSANRDRLSDSLELCFREGMGSAAVVVPGADAERLDEELSFTEHFECQNCQLAYQRPEPSLFSFNSPNGACPTCHGFGNTVGIDPELVIPDPRLSLEEGPIDPFNKPKYRRFGRRLLDFARSEGLPTDIPFSDLSDRVQAEIWNGKGDFLGVLGFFNYLESKNYKMHIRVFMARYRSYTRCTSCQGARLRQEAKDVYVGNWRIFELTTQPISTLLQSFSDLKLGPANAEIGAPILREIMGRLKFLRQVGLDYLTVDRLTSSLSGGEVQRIHLAASLGATLVGALYVLDEPTVGLHPRDEQQLIDVLKRLRDLGNTIVVVEHERQMIEEADFVVDLGPGAGELGGDLVFSGSPIELSRGCSGLTGQYLRGEKTISIPTIRRRARNEKQLLMIGASQHNLKDIDVSIPLGCFVCVTGVSGSGKSTLIENVLYGGIKRHRREWKGPVGSCREIRGWEQLSDLFLVDQSPIGKTSRSNPVTYLKIFDEIRKILAATPDAQRRQLTPGNFSFNIPGGRCESCQGMGTLTIQMQFLADVEVTCDACNGKRYQKEILEVHYNGKNIFEILDLTIDQAIRFFRDFPGTTRKLRVLIDVGLGYLRLGQSASTLSGGEAQRLKLASFLSKKITRNAFFIFDEPTTGLHFDDIHKLLNSLRRLIDQGASVLVIEHNLDVIKCADWIIDLGPEGGEKGGFLVAAAPPSELAKIPESHTGKYLANYFDNAESVVQSARSAK